MTRKKIFPYFYGDKGPDKTFENFQKDSRFYKIVSIGMAPLLFGATPALASVGKKAAAESTRTAACAAAGACLTIAAQQSKCGNMPAATAALCGAAFALCIEKTAQAVSNS
jgi:hypothetical protein